MQDETTGAESAENGVRAARDEATTGPGGLVEPGPEAEAGPAFDAGPEPLDPTPSPGHADGPAPAPSDQGAGGMGKEAEVGPVLEPPDQGTDGLDKADKPAELLPESEVFIEIPADRLYVVLARSAAVHLGAVLHLGITDVTDLRLAVDEACALFLLHPAFPDGGSVGLACRFAAYQDELRVTVRAPVPAGFAPDTEAIGWIMLGALVDDLAWTRQDGYGTVTLTKRFIPPRAH